MAGQESMPRGKVAFTLFTSTPWVCWTLLSSVASLQRMLFLLGGVLGILEVCRWAPAGAATDCLGVGKVSIFNGKVTFTLSYIYLMGMLDTLTAGQSVVVMAGVPA